jgi:uncharacterized protein YoxC
MGLKIQRLYFEGETEFATFETPIDKKGKKLHIDDPELESKSIQPYFDDVPKYKQSLSNINDEIGQNN